MSREKFMFAISSPDEILFRYASGLTGIYTNILIAVGLLRIPAWTK